MSDFCMSIQTKKCDICHCDFDLSKLISADLVSDFLTKLIQQSNPDWNSDSLICKEDLNRFRSLYVREAIREDMGEITQLESDVLQSIKEHEIITSNLNQEFEQELTFGDKLSDRIAYFGGSWKFIISFAVILVSWITLNSLSLFQKPFDPYPYILLNLVLSCLAALQAPIIMMSQNRQESKDRLRSEMDYKVNLKAELEIRHLKAKLDQLASHQWQRLLEIQELQTDLMEELAHRNKKS